MPKDLGPDQSILIIDDDPGIVKVLEQGLITRGCRVLTAFDFEQGLKKAREFKPDLIILDVILPDENGFTGMKILKDDPQTTSIPVMMLTVKISDEDIQRGLDLGVEDYLTKPVHLEMFLKRIRNFFSPSAGHREKEPGRIMIVEDEEEMAQLLKIEMECEGYEVRLAHNGKTGLEQIPEFMPDLVLLDAMIPDMSGYEVLKILKKDPQTSNTAVFMLTAKGLEGDIQKGIALGADDYISKPFHAGLLIKRIKNHLQRNHG